MDALRITATLRGGICCPGEGPQLDTLLASTIAKRLGYPPPRHANDIRKIEVPLARSACDRIYLCSVGIYDIECVEKDWTNRRFPTEKALIQADPNDLRVINIKAGAQKSYRLPRERAHLLNDSMYWFAEGDAPAVAEILVDVHHLGKRRAVGLGEVIEWKVERWPAWTGFPVLWPDGTPIRPLPLDWPGVADTSQRGWRTLADTARGIVSWARHLEEELWLPSPAT